MLALLRTGRSRSILLTAWTEHVGFGGTVEGHWTLKDGKISVVPERVDGSPPDVLAGNFPKDGLKRKGTGDLQLCFENAYSSTNAEYLTDL